jgi:hypothetical protein
VGALFKCPTWKLKDQYMGNLSTIGNTRSKASICQALTKAYEDDIDNKEAIRTICENFSQCLVTICCSQVRLYSYSLN